MGLKSGPSDTLTTGGLDILLLKHDKIRCCKHRRYLGIMFTVTQIPTRETWVNRLKIKVPVVNGRLPRVHSFEYKTRVKGVHVLLLLLLKTEYTNNTPNVHFTNFDKDCVSFEKLFTIDDDYNNNII